MATHNQLAQRLDAAFPGAVPGFGTDPPEPGIIGPLDARWTPPPGGGSTIDILDDDGQALRAYTYPALTEDDPMNPPDAAESEGDTTAQPPDHSGLLAFMDVPHEPSEAPDTEGADHISETTVTPSHDHQAGYRTSAQFQHAVDVASERVGQCSHMFIPGTVIKPSDLLAREVVVYYATTRTLWTYVGWGV